MKPRLLTESGFLFTHRGFVSIFACVLMKIETKINYHVI